MGRIKLSIPQSKSFLSKAKSVGVVAGFGSGKTYAALTKAFDLLLKYPGVPVGYAAPTYGLIKDIWYPAIEDHCITHNFKYHISKSEHVIKIHGLGNIICRSLSNPDKIVGFEVGDFLIDEMDILKTEDALNAWRKCKARARYKFPKRPGEDRKRNQMFAYTTPEGFKATYQLFKKDPIPGSELIQMSTYSNAKNLPPDYIEELKANYPAQLIEAYIEGNFVNLTSGTVYPQFDRKLNHSDEEEDGREPLHIGMDFNIWNMSAIIHVYRSGLPVAVDEISSATDTQRIIEIIKGRYGTDRRITIYPDASGAVSNTTNASISDISLLKQANFNVDAPRANPRVRDRIVSMNAMFLNALGERRYKVNTNKCKEYTEDLEQQVYDKNGEPDKEHNKDHKPDASGYFIHRKHAALARPRLSVN